jgi:hypothetical protein
MKRTKSAKPLLAPSTRAVILGVLSATMILPGCSDGRPARVPVAGKVLIDGKPVGIGAVRFTPADGRPATGELGPDGSFRLTTFDLADGAVVGTHTVTIHSTEELSPTQLRWNVPKKYQMAGTSGLTQKIDGPTDSLTIELTWGGEKGPIVEFVNRGE